MKNRNLVLIRNPDAGEDETIVRVNGVDLSLKVVIEGNKVKEIWNGPPMFGVYRRELLDRIDAELARPAVEAALKKD